MNLQQPECFGIRLPRAPAQVLSPLLCALRPPIRASVSSHTLSTEERHEIAKLVNLHIAFGLEYRQVCE